MIAQRFGNKSHLPLFFLDSNSRPGPCFVTHEIFNLVERREDNPSEQVVDLMSAAHLGGSREKTGDHRNSGRSSRGRKCIPQSIVVNQPSLELNIRGKGPDGVDGMSDLVDNLGDGEVKSAKSVLPTTLVQTENTR